MNKIFICGGGTGGHFFSGVALAEEYLRLHPEGRVHFVGTRNGIEARTPLPDSRMSISFIQAKGLKGKGIISQISGIGNLLLGFFESCRLLLTHRPQIVFGVGGYASAPTLFAALVLKIFLGFKIAVLEQNSSPGLVNRLFSHFPVFAFSAFEDPRFTLVNLPLRAHILEQAKRANEFHWPPKMIFVLGGSQGARGLNSRWKEILPKIREILPELGVIHQTGRDEEKDFRDFYASLNIRAEVFAFSSEIPKYYDKADLMICRSGAMTIFELMAFRRPAIFVPFPFAADDHQYKNALSVQNPEWIIRENDWNIDRVVKLLSSRTPAVPERAGGAVETWDSIFRRLM